MNNVKEETKIADLLERDGVLHTNTRTEFNEKPYKLRKLSSKDISPMLKILKKVDLRKLKDLFNEIDLTDLVQKNKVESTEENEEVQENEVTDVNISEVYMKIGGTIIFEAIPTVLDTLDNCIADINKLLASVANMSLEELENMDLDIYFNLIYDFINKEEFAGFMKVVSKFLK